MTIYESPTVVPDVEGAVRAWLRTKLPALGNRVFFGIPAEGVAYPLVTVSRIGGGTRDPRLSVHSWGSTKASAAGVAQSIAAAVEGLGTELLAAGVLAQGGTVDTILWQPAAPDGFPRYVVDVTIFVSAV